MKKIILLLILMVSVSFAEAQSTYDQYIEDQLIDYSLLLRYKDTIKLSDQQVKSIQDFYAQNGFNFEQKSKDYQKALSLLQQRVEADASRNDVMTAFSEVLSLENDIKRNRLKFLLHSREILEDKQRNTLRLIGRSHSLVIKSGPEGVINGYISDIKPIYKLVDKDKKITYVREGMLNNIDASKIQTIDVRKGVDLTIDGEQLRDQNVITITSKEAFGQEKVSLYVRSGTQEVGKIGDPLIVVFHKGKKRKIKGNTEETFQDLDPSSIKAITVLKGKSAAELYGKEGKDGVVEVYLKDSAQYQIK